MGMSTHAVGVRDLDGQFAKMIDAKVACEDAGVGYPKEVETYFSVGDADPTMSEDDLRRFMAEVDIDRATSECGNDGSSGIEVDLSKLPDGVKAIRFLNSW